MSVGLLTELIKPRDVYFAIFGILWLIIVSCRILLKSLRGFRAFILSRFFAQNLTKYGKWAIVTGATDGIGKAYGRELAKRKLNLILISRNLERLKTTAEELEREYDIKTKVIQADFSSGMEIYPLIGKEIEEKDVGILVNNVGQQFNLPCEYLELSANDLVDLIYINMVSVLMMSYMALNIMIPKGNGCVVNVSSLSSLKPLPLLSIYSASKAYMTHLSQALRYEYITKDIIVQCLIPSYVSTKLVNFSNYLRRSNLCVPTASRYASSAINTLNLLNLTTGYWSHELQYAVYEGTPIWLWNAMSLYILRMLDNRNLS